MAKTFMSPSDIIGNVGIKKRKVLTEEHRRKIGEGNRGKTLSEETKKKISEAHMGMTASEETRRKIGLIHRGKIISKEHRERLKVVFRDRQFSEETRKRISEANSGKVRTEEQRQRTSEILRGKKQSAETIRKRAIANTGKVRTEEYRRSRSGENNPSWRGGLATLAEKARRSWEYHHWRRAVYERDDYTCQVCGKRGVALQAHHIKLVSRHSDLIYDIDNGMTLCKNCHLDIRGKETQFADRFTAHVLSISI